MITSIILLVVTGFLYLVAQLFSVFAFVIPSQIEDAFTLFFSWLHVFDGVFPVTDLVLALLFIISVEAGMYLAKMFLWGYSLIPWLGKKADLPKHGQHRR